MPDIHFQMIVIYSLIRVKDFFKARELYLRIIGNEAEFGDLAAEFSEGIEKKTRGVVGPMPLGRSHPNKAKKKIILQLILIACFWS